VERYAETLEVLEKILQKKLSTTAPILKRISMIRKSISEILNKTFRSP